MSHRAEQCRGYAPAQRADGQTRGYAASAGLDHRTFTEPTTE